MKCDICSELQKDKKAYFYSTYESSISNRIIHETENLYVIPSIGQIVEGYLLIVPKNHYLSIGQMPVKLIAEVEEMKEYVYKHLSKLYKPPIFFEHGSIRETGGCGVYHAHIHAVPCGHIEGILAQISERFNVQQIESMLELIKYVDLDKSYIYFEDCNMNKYSFEVDEIPSQYFRKILAELISNEKWDWHSYKYNDDKLHKTYFTIKNFLESSSIL
jgi:diadenosine tetraphosphate (Ap4A) HIT family hydrolase